MAPDPRKLSNIPPDQDIYEGAVNGQLQFPNSCRGYGIRNSKTGSFVDMGAAMTMALALTERCARAGRGKVFYLASEWDFNVTQIPPSKWHRDAVKIPALLYVDFVWDQTLRDQWFATPHWQRLDQLSAAATGIHYTTPVMPITLNWEEENSKYIITEGIPGAVSLFVNGSGFTYLGFTSDISATPGVHWNEAPTALSDGTTRISYWQADLPAVTQFRMHDGDAVVAELRRMYRLARPETIKSFRQILELRIQAHHTWAEVGGYCIEDDKDLGPELAAEVRTVLRLLQVAEETGSRLYRIKQTIAQWGLFDQLAVDGFRAAARRGVAAATRFIIRSQEWANLDFDAKNLVIEMWKLEQEGDGNDNIANGATDTSRASPLAR